MDKNIKDNEIISVCMKTDNTDSITEISVNELFALKAKAALKKEKDNTAKKMYESALKLFGTIVFDKETIEIIANTDIIKEDDIYIKLENISPITFAEGFPILKDFTEELYEGLKKIPKGNSKTTYTKKTNDTPININHLPYLFTNGIFLPENKSKKLNRKASKYVRDSIFINELGVNEKKVLYYYTMLYRATGKRSFVININELIKVLELNRDGRTMESIKKAHDTLIKKRISYVFENEKGSYVRSIHFISMIDTEINDGSTEIHINRDFIDELKPTDIRVINLKEYGTNAIEIIGQANITVICNIIAYVLSKHDNRKEFNLTTELNKLLIQRFNKNEALTTKQIERIKEKLPESFNMFGKKITRKKPNIYEIHQL